MRNNLIAASVAALLSVSAAHAGGFTAPVVEIEPPLVVTPAPSDWQGAYAGITLGYAFGGDDDIGVRPPGVDIGSAELSGWNAGLRLGYRWQRDRWVVGPEIAYVGGDISDDFEFDSAPLGLADSEFESEVDSLLGIRLKTGYLVRPDTLVYGIAGWQQGDFTYSVDGEEEGYDADGYVLGLGVERKLTDRMSVTGEYEYANFGSTDIEYLGRTTVATPEHSNVKLGLNFSF
ncbi:outer membrane protein [Paracoccus salipaludis]|uniref:Autotransporter outer membrane beta-barrel domain-containing protein n=1 Tax=Paracoccus salipaludis TaxID=2032623 RepID=A0A2A2GJA5_9RHOB|nr:porin family protein [Paracoccus salipaludis]PAU97591.1 autotransporter outer membrane beta-barrel domain-containing protein [Paracoccus salipaludis]